MLIFLELEYVNEKGTLFEGFSLSFEGKLKERWLCSVVECTSKYPVM